MVKITMKYERKDFFGNSDYVMESVDCLTEEAAQHCFKKAFNRVLNDYEAGMDLSTEDTALTIFREWGDTANDVVRVKDNHDKNGSCDIMATAAARTYLKNIIAAAALKKLLQEI